MAASWGATASRRTGSTIRGASALGGVSDRHVLALDNVAAVRALVRDLLEEAGYRVSDQASAETDRAAIAGLRPDLIVLDDPSAGDDGGCSLLHTLRTDPATATIPVVLCTGAVREVAAREGHLAGMGVRIVLKPFNIDRLVAVVSEALADAPR